MALSSTFEKKKKKGGGKKTWLGWGSFFIYDTIGRGNFEGLGISQLETRYLRHGPRGTSTSARSLLRDQQSNNPTKTSTERRPCPLFLVSIRPLRRSRFGTVVKWKDILAYGHPFQAARIAIPYSGSVRVPKLPF